VGIRIRNYWFVNCCTAAINRLLIVDYWNLETWRTRDFSNKLSRDDYVFWREKQQFSKNVPIVRAGALRQRHQKEKDRLEPNAWKNSTIFCKNGSSRMIMGNELLHDNVILRDRFVKSSYCVSAATFWAPSGFSSCLSSANHSHPRSSSERLFKLPALPFSCSSCQCPSSPYSSFIPTPPKHCICDSSTPPPSPFPSLPPPLPQTTSLPHLLSDCRTGSTNGPLQVLKVSDLRLQEKLMMMCKMFINNRKS